MSRLLAALAPDSRFWRVATAIIVGFAILGNAAFAALDARLPPDLNRVYTDLPQLYAHLGDVRTWDNALVLAVSHTTGWYNLLLAAGARVVGAPAFVFETGLVAWYGLLLVITARLAHRLAGFPAACAAVALTASAPVVFAFARQGWVHVMEAALALGVLALWAEEPGLHRRRTRYGIAALGIALLWMRTSGIIFAASLLVTILSGWRAAGPGYFRRAAGAVGPWAVGLIPILVVGRSYVGDKLASRDRYFAMVRPLSEQLPDDVGLSVLALMSVGLALLVFTRRGLPLAVGALLGVWVVVGFGLVFTFGVGIDNFTVIVPAGAILAGAGLARAWTALTLAPVALWAPVAVSFWLPDTTADALLRVIPGVPIGLRDDHSDNFARTYQEIGVAEIRALLDATCPDRANTGCAIAVDRGLFRPSPEEPGRLELFLLGEHHVTLNSLAEAFSIPGSMNVLARYGCAASDSGWMRRYPNAFSNARMIATAQGLFLAWKRSLSGNCSFEWYTKGGIVAGPAKLPPGDALGADRTVSGRGVPFGDGTYPGDVKIPGGGMGMGGQMMGGPMMGGQMMGGQMMGGQMMGGQMMGGQTMGGQRVGGQMMGGQTMGGQNMGGQMMGGQTMGGQMMGGQTMGGQTMGGQTMGSQVPGAVPGTPFQYATPRYPDPSTLGTAPQ